MLLAMFRLTGAAAFVLLVSLALTGCGASPSSSCVATEALFPASLTLDHTAAPPENQTSYGIGEKVLQGNGAIPAHLAGVGSLAVSEPVHVPVSTAVGQVAARAEDLGQLGDTGGRLLHGVSAGPGPG